MSAFPDLIKACNPAVWDATVTTMRMSAFFRYVKENFPEEWKSFLLSIQELSPKPRVTTPTIMFSKENKTLDNLFP
jgi:hypothetical protein